MKPSLLRAGLAALLLLDVSIAAGSSTTPEPATDSRVRCIVGLSPFLDRADKDAVFRNLVRLVLEDLPTGASVGFYDAFHLRTIARIDIPETRAFRSSRTRANQFKDPIRRLKEFLATEHTAPKSDALDFTAAIRLPQFIRFTGENLLAGPGGTSILLLGSPLYMDEKETAFSMISGYFPSDGHLRAGPEKSLFGLDGRDAFLESARVWFGYFGDPWISDVHREKVQRFWTLYFQLQGAALAAFTSDLPTVFESILDRPDILETVGHTFQIDPDQNKIEMLRVSREIGATDWITRESLPARALDPPEQFVGPLKIGIRWAGRIDLDLYARPLPGAETLFFEHTRSPEGYYFKDHRSSPDREFEFIEFEKPVDVRRLEASVNFYEGTTSESPRGEVRIEFGGRIYSGDFTIDSHSGNRGSGGPDQRAFWAVLDISRILNLSGAAPTGDHSTR